MRRRIGVMVGLDLDDEAADPVHQERGADQVGRDLMHAAREKGTLERLAQGGIEGRRGSAGALRIWSHFNGKNQRKQAGMLTLCATVRRAGRAGLRLSAIGLT
jgi:hypothetical protein